MVVEKVFQRKGGFAKKLATSISMNPPSWQAPDLNTLPAGTAGDLIRYGRELIASTSKYLGPHGSVQKVSNGMNCQNCHLDAGTRLYANSFAAVAATYPRYRERSGKIESVEFRINDCLQRSLNGKMIDSTGKEMQAMVAYIKWVGKDVQKGVQPTGNAVEQLAFLPVPLIRQRGEPAMFPNARNVMGPMVPEPYSQTLRAMCIRQCGDRTAIIPVRVCTA